MNCAKLMAMSNQIENNKLRQSVSSQHPKMKSSMSKFMDKPVSHQANKQKTKMKNHLEALHINGVGKENAKSQL